MKTDKVIAIINEHIDNCNDDLKMPYQEEVFYDRVNAKIDVLEDLIDRIKFYDEN